MSKILDMNSLPDFIIVGGVVGIAAYILFHILTGSVPGIGGLLAPAAAGMVLGAMLFIFSTGIKGG